MKNDTKFSQHTRTIFYYCGILLSVGLIWGGGMAVLRGRIPEGLVAIALGVLLQLGLQGFGVASSSSTGPAPDWRRLIVRDHLHDMRRTAATKSRVTELAQSDKKSAKQARMWNRDVRGSDGAILKTSPHRLEQLLLETIEEKEKI